MPPMGQPQMMPGMAPFFPTPGAPQQQMFMPMQYQMPGLGGAGQAPTSQDTKGGDTSK